MQRIALVILLIVALIIPSAVLAASNVRVSRSTRDYYLSATARSGNLNGDAKITFTFQVKDEGSWISLEAYADGSCEYGAWDCSHSMRDYDVVDAGYDDGEKKVTVYADDLITSRDFKYEPWGVIVIEPGGFDYVLVIGYKIINGRYVKFVRADTLPGKFRPTMTDDQLGRARSH